jgi:hypothetical protein
MFERQCVLHTTRPLLCIVAPTMKERITPAWPRRKKKKGLRKYLYVRELWISL